MATRRVQFERKHRWLHGTAVLLHLNASRIEQNIRDRFKDGIAAVGVATAGGTTSLRGLQMERDDAKYLLADFSGFLRLIREQTLIGAFRALIDYMHDLLADIAAHSPSSMPQALREKVKLRRIKASEFPGKLERVNLPLSPAGKNYFHLVRTIRNVLEHNDGMINSDYVSLANTGVVGQRLEVDGERLRETLEFVREVALSLERRAKQLGLIGD